MKLAAILTAGMLGVASVLGAIGAAPVAHAHAELVSSDPVDGAVLDTPPTRVAFTFNEALMPDFVRFIATDPQGDTGDLPVSFVEGSTAGIDWPVGAPPGEWRVSYRVVSQDGHPIEGGITFTYAAPRPGPTPTPGPTSASPAPTPAPTSGSASPTVTDPSESTPSMSPAADTSGGSSGWWIAGLAVAVIAVAGVVLALVARRRA